MTAEQKVAVITGGGSGLGLAIAKKFNEEGIRNVIVGRSAERLQAACASMSVEGCIQIVSDLTELQRIPELVDSVIERCGRIDILVNNAGIHLKSPITEVSDDDYQRVITANQTAVFSLSREVAQHMIPLRRGVILNISSMASQYGIPQVIASGRVEQRVAVRDGLLQSLGCSRPGGFNRVWTATRMGAWPSLPGNAGPQGGDGATSAA